MPDPKKDLYKLALNGLSVDSSVKADIVSKGDQIRREVFVFLDSRINSSSAGKLAKEAEYAFLYGEIKKYL